MAFQRRSAFHPVVGPLKLIDHRIGDPVALDFAQRPTHAVDEPEPPGKTKADCQA